MRRLRLLVSLCLLQWTSSLKVDDSVHYVIKFDDPDTPGGDKLVEDNDKTHDSITVRSRENENYVCHLPRTEPENSSPLSSYTGPNPSTILSALYKEKLCSYKMDPYWSYELCHGRYLLQFHEDKSTRSPRTEYYLGNMHVDYASLSADPAHPPTRMIDGEQLPYFPVLYTQGTTCDITGKPRTTNVLYICVENARDQLFSISEVSSCNYEVIVLTHRLCKHPSYKPAAKKVFDIVCYNTDDKDNAKPVALQELEQFQEDTFKREYTITHTSPTPDEYGEDVEEAIENLQQKMQQERELKLAGQKRAPGLDTLANSKKIVQETVNRIFSGAECIHGGQGWWKYEFCYGAKVTQYHVEANGDRVDIMLGEFDEAVHKAWVDQDRQKRQPKKVDNQVSQVSHLYVRGDICDETSAHRSVEVRLRCKRADGSSLAVSISLFEPRTCAYILTVESERFCEPLQYSDEYGLIQLEPANKKFGAGDLPV